ncbi:hypothetical protein BD410DRAFT_352945 [Rickenella mellea]|uniref:Uncharacterized protein n=1 Tax=Rickenella mellea TaxID=50990 RepID=A0A4Y7QLW7_9AGAM|nr:hypothetical protein BD410DRAFT_352945 [Rickenella mellea]
MPSCSPVYPSFTLVVTEKLWRSGRVCHSRATYGRRPAFDIDTSVDALMTTMDDRWEARGPGPFLSTIVRVHQTNVGVSLTDISFHGPPLSGTNRPRRE